MGLLALQAVWATPAEGGRHYWPEISAWEADPVLPESIHPVHGSCSSAEVECSTACKYFAGSRSQGSTEGVQGSEGCWAAAHSAVLHQPAGSMRPSRGPGCRPQGVQEHACEAQRGGLHCTHGRLPEEEHPCRLGGSLSGEVQKFRSGVRAFVGALAVCWCCLLLAGMDTTAVQDGHPLFPGQCQFHQLCPCYSTAIC